MLLKHGWEWNLCRGSVPFWLVVLSSGEGCWLQPASVSVAAGCGRQDVSDTTELCLFHKRERFMTTTMYYTCIYMTSTHNDDVMIGYIHTRVDWLRAPHMPNGIVVTSARGLHICVFVAGNAVQ